VAEGELDGSGLAQGIGVQVAQDLLDQSEVVAAAAAVQQRHDLPLGQCVAERGRGRGAEHGWRGFVPQVRERDQRLWVELEQDQAEPVHRRLQRPDGLLVLPGERAEACAPSVVAGSARCWWRSVRSTSASNAASPASDLLPAWP